MFKYVLLCLFSLAACAPIFAAVPTLVPTPITITIIPTATSTPQSTIQATALPTIRPTNQPINKPANTPTNTPVLPNTPAPLPPKVSLNLMHEYQKWNNCGPVSLGVVATYFGIPRNQFQIAPAVKGFEMDKNVGPQEMQAYLQSIGLRAIVRVNGSRTILERLLAAGFPVIVHQWLLKPDTELVGHYRVVRGYDNSAGILFFSDPFTGPNKSYSFAEIEKWWQPWNHRYIVAYRAEQEAKVRALLAEQFDEQQNWQGALNASLASIQRNPNNAYEYFNLGDDRLALGDAAGAVEAYEKSFALGLPPHFYWYNFGPLEAYDRVGNSQRILDWTTPMLKETGNIEEVRFWRGKAYLALGQKQKAREEFALAVQLNAHYSDAKAMLAQVQ